MDCKITLSFSNQKIKDRSETLINKGMCEVKFKFIVSLIIVNSQSGNHFVWVKAVYHTPEWQNYFSRIIDSRTPVVTTRTKAEYDEIYSLVRVRQVICYSKDGKKLFDSGDDRSAGWGYVNASDPVGIVGEYLGK